MWGPPRPRWGDRERTTRLLSPPPGPRLTNGSPHAQTLNSALGQRGMQIPLRLPTAVLGGNAAAAGLPGGGGPSGSASLQERNGGGVGRGQRPPLPPAQPRAAWQGDTKQDGGRGGDAPPSAEQGGEAALGFSKVPAQVRTGTRFAIVDPPRGTPANTSEVLRPPPEKAERRRWTTEQSRRREPAPLVRWRPDPAGTASSLASPRQSRSRPTRGSRGRAHGDAGEQVVRKATFEEPGGGDEPHQTRRLRHGSAGSVTLLRRD